MSLLALVAFIFAFAVVATTIPFLILGDFKLGPFKLVSCKLPQNISSCSVFTLLWREAAGPEECIDLGGQLGVLFFGEIMIEATVAFWSLFAFRYFRFFLNIVGYFLYKPSNIPVDPTYTSQDVTVIIPMVVNKDSNGDFPRCLRSICANNPAHVFVVAVGRAMHNRIDNHDQLSIIRVEYPGVNLQVYHTDVANRRRQIDHIIPQIQTSLVSLVDAATVCWGPRFLRSALAPFEDAHIWLVNANKRAVRRRWGDKWSTLLSSGSFWHFIKAVSSERHNFESRAHDAITGNVSLIPGAGTGNVIIIRSAVIRDPAFRTAYINERLFLGGLLGPSVLDDGNGDGFLVRWVLRRGAGIKFQYDDDARIEIPAATILEGEEEEDEGKEGLRFLSRCLRRERTVWRSNPAALRILHVWIYQPYSVYSIYLTSFVNFALFFDVLLLYLFCQTRYVKEASDWTSSVAALGLWMFCSKLVKLVPYFWREPQDLVFVPGYICFAYYHSFIKLWALLTFWNVSESGRKLDIDKQ